MIRKLLTIAATLMIGACGGGDGQSGGKMIAFSQANIGEPYRAAQKSLMEKLIGETDGLSLVVSDAQQDSSKQIAQIETFIRQRPSVLIVAPNERAALTDVMGKAVGAGIPVIMLERDILQPHYTTYIRIDNREIGRKAGEYIVEQLRAKYGQPRGNIVILRGLLGVEAQINRDQGAREVFARYPGIKVLADPVADWLQARAKDRMVEVLRTQPKIDVVYAHNDPMAVGANLAARELGRDKEMIFVGVDGLGGPAGGIAKVRDGVLAATFVYPLGVKEAVDITKRIATQEGYQPPKVVTLESTMVTRDNADEMYEAATL